jgi:hypothetical protein
MVPSKEFSRNGSWDSGLVSDPSYEPQATADPEPTNKAEPQDVQPRPEFNDVNQHFNTMPCQM